LLVAPDINKMNSRRAWTQEVVFVLFKEDQSIMRLVQCYGHKNWAKIAIELAQQFGSPQRSGKQCR